MFLDNDLCIKRFTEQAKKVIRLIPTDVGRSIGDLVSTIRYDRLVEDAEKVLRTLVFKEVEVRGEGDTTYLMRVLPYRTTDNVIDGLVLTFVDVTKLKTLQDEQERLLEALHQSPLSVFGQGRELVITWASGPVFGRPPAELVGRADRDLFGPEDAGLLEGIKRQALETGVPASRRVALDVNGARRSYDLHVVPRRGPAGQVVGVTCLAVDATGGV